MRGVRVSPKVYSSMYSTADVADSADHRSVTRVDVSVPAGCDTARFRRDASRESSAGAQESAQFGRGSFPFLIGEALQELLEPCLPHRLITDADQLHPIWSGRY